MNNLIKNWNLKSKCQAYFKFKKNSNFYFSSLNDMENFNRNNIIPNIEEYYFNEIDTTCIHFLNISLLL